MSSLLPTNMSHRAPMVGVSYWYLFLKKQYWHVIITQTVGATARQQLFRLLHAYASSQQKMQVVVKTTRSVWCHDGTLFKLQQLIHTSPVAGVAEEWQPAHTIRVLSQGACRTDMDIVQTMFKALFLSVVLLTEGLCVCQAWILRTTLSGTFGQFEAVFTRLRLSSEREIGTRQCAAMLAWDRTMP